MKSESLVLNPVLSEVVLQRKSILKNMENL